MSYQVVKFLHVVAALVFVAVHGASMAVWYVARKERDRKRLLAVLDFSAATAKAMYVSLVAIVASGLWLGFLRTSLFEERWYWLALVVLATTTVAMLGVAKPFTARIRAASGLRPSGVPRKSDEELAELLRGPRVHVIFLIGVAGLGGLLYLMTFQPDLGGGPKPFAAPPVTTTASSVTTSSEATGQGEPTAPSVGTTTAPPIDDAALLALGREVFEGAVGGCARCHGVQGEGSAVAPRIAGRSREVIAGALGWVADMGDIELTPDELEAVARYVAQLPH